MVILISNNYLIIKIYKYIKMEINRNKNSLNEDMCESIIH